MDAVQDVFHRLIRYGHSFRGGTFVPWLFRIARNVAIDRHRQSSRHVQHGDHEAVDTAPLPDSYLELGESKELLGRAMDRIPPQYREVLILSRYADLTYKQIAGVLDCSVESVKVRVHRALVALRATYLEQIKAES